MLSWVEHEEKNLTSGSVVLGIFSHVSHTSFLSLFPLETAYDWITVDWANKNINSKKQITYLP